MRRLPKRDYVALLVAVIVFSALFVLEGLNADFAKLAATHPVVGSVVTGFMVAFTGLFVIDAVRVHLNNQKWDAVSRLSLLAVARELTLLIDAFLWLGSGRTPHSPIAVTMGKKIRINGIRLKNGLDLSRDWDYGHLTYALYKPMLEVLIQDKAWCRLAEIEISGAKDRHRQKITGLLPAMFLTPDAVSILNRTVGLNHWMSAVQSQLNLLASQASYSHKNHPLHQLQKEVVNDWMTFLAEAISLREDLWTLSRKYSEAWRSNRNVLDPKHRAELARRQPSGLETRTPGQLRGLAGMPLNKTRLEIR